MTAWVIIRPEEPQRTRMTIDEQIALAEAVTGSIVWRPSDREMLLVEAGFVPALSPRLWQSARRCSEQLQGVA